MTTYNRYVRMDNGDYARIPMEEPIKSRQSPIKPPLKNEEPAAPITRQKSKTEQSRPIEARAANRFLEHFNLGDIDSGDLLLLSVLFFLFRQDADEELLMALGLLLIL